MNDDLNIPQPESPAVARTAQAHFSEGAAAAVTPIRSKATLAALLTDLILRDGEIVQLILKPSLWFVVLSSLRIVAFALIVMIAARVYDERMPGNSRAYLEAGMFLITARLMWATMQWMSRFYILTDQRILRLSGVFTIETFECPLRRVARTRIVRTSLERIVGVGSIEIIPQDADRPIDIWQTIARPKEIQKLITAAIHRAKQ